MEQFRKTFSLLFIFLVGLRISEAIAGNPITYKIGGVLSINASQIHFKQTIEVNYEHYIYYF